MLAAHPFPSAARSLDVLQLRSSKQEEADLFFWKPLFTGLSAMSAGLEQLKKP
jgi:hypothetical protein